MAKTSLYEYELKRFLDEQDGGAFKAHDTDEAYGFEDHAEEWQEEHEQEDIFALPLISFLGASTITAIAGAFAIAHGGAPVSQTMLFCFTWVVATSMLLVLGNQTCNSQFVISFLQRSFTCRIAGSVVCAFAALSISALSYQIVSGANTVQAKAVHESLAPAAAALSAPVPAEPKPAPVATKQTTATDAAQSVHYRREHISHAAAQTALLPAPVAPSRVRLKASGTSRPAPKTAVRKVEGANTSSRQRSTAALSIDPDPLQTLSQIDPTTKALSIDPVADEVQPTAPSVKKRVRPSRKKIIKRRKVRRSKRVARKRVVTKRRNIKRSRVQKRKPGKKTLKRTVRTVAQQIQSRFAPKKKKATNPTVTPTSDRPRTRTMGRVSRPLGSS